MNQPQRTISSNSFKQIISNSHPDEWKKSGGVIIIDDIRVEDSIELDDSTYSKPIILENCDIISINFISSQFHGSFKFINCNIDSILFDGESTFNDKVSITKCKVDNFNVSNSTFMGTVEIINSIFKHKFEIRNGTFNDFVNISKNEFLGDNVTIGGSFNVQSLRLDSSVFVNTVCFKNISVEKQLIITDNVDFKSDVFFDSGRFNNVLVSGGMFKTLNINGGHFKKISFTKNPKINDKIKISLTEDLIIENLYFDFTKIDCKYYLFEGINGKIHKIELEGLFLKDYLCEFDTIPYFV